MEINGKIKTRREVTGKISTAALHGTVAVDGGAEPFVQGEETIHGRVTTTQGVGGNLNGTSALSGDIDGNVKNRLLKDYNILINKPSIEGVELKGNKTLEDFGITRSFYNTTEGWDSQPSLIAKEKAVYFYWDHKTDKEGNPIPGVKIGDGVTLLKDLPFTTDIQIDYEIIDNKPSINGVILEGEKSFEQLGRDDIKNSRIKEIIDSQYNLIFGGN